MKLIAYLVSERKPSVLKFAPNFLGANFKNIFFQSEKLFSV